MSADAMPGITRTRRRLYEAPGASAVEPLAPEVLPPVCREVPLEVDRNVRPETEEQARTNRALAIVRKYTAWSAGVDVLPLGWLGNGALCGAVNVRMIRELCACYGREFRQELAVTAAAAAAGGIVNAGIIGFVGRGLVDLVPGAGLVRLVTSAASSGSVTYLTGRMFVYHFELGGTLFGLDAGKTRAMLLKLKEQDEAAGVGGGARWSRAI